MPELMPELQEFDDEEGRNNPGSVMSSEGKG